jgi:hypothetical protein
LSGLGVGYGEVGGGGGGRLHGRLAEATDLDINDIVARGQVVEPKHPPADPIDVHRRR